MNLPRPVAIVADPLSSASLRVLSVLRHKGISLPVNAVRLRTGEQHGEAHRALNPGRAVPVLLLEDGEALSQSLAILEYLEAFYPEPALMPSHPGRAARVRSLCSLVAADIHPLTNMRVRQRVATTMGDEAGREWVRHWSDEGLVALEGWLLRWAGRFAVGDTPTLADFFIVPMVISLHRLGCPPREDSRVAEIYRAAMTLPAFAQLTSETKAA